MSQGYYQGYYKDHYEQAYKDDHHLTTKAYKNPYVDLTTMMWWLVARKHQRQRPVWSWHMWCLPRPVPLWTWPAQRSPWCPRTHQSPQPVWTWPAQRPWWCPRTHQRPQPVWTWAQRSPWCLWPQRPLRMVNVMAPNTSAVMNLMPAAPRWTWCLPPHLWTWHPWTWWTLTTWSITFVWFRCTWTCQKDMVLALSSPRLKQGQYRRSAKVSESNDEFWLFFG